MVPLLPQLIHQMCSVNPEPSCNIVDIIEKIISTTPDSISALDGVGATPLHYAAQAGCSDNVRYLLRARANIDALDSLGNSPLDYARRFGRTHIVELLMQHGARLTTPYNPLAALNNVANAWGIHEFRVFLGNCTFPCAGSSIANPPLGMIARALACYIRLNPSHQIPHPETIIHAFGVGTGHYQSLFPPAELVQRIRQNQLVVLQSGYRHHSMVYLFYNGYLARCNRNSVLPTLVRRIRPSAMTMSVFEDIRAARDLDPDRAMHLHNRIFTELGREENDTTRTIMGAPQQEQRHPFCAYNSAEAALYTILALQILEANPHATMADVKRIYKNCTTFFRLSFLIAYLDTVRPEDRFRYDRCNHLLHEIRYRLLHGWHPERFALRLFCDMRNMIIERLG